MEEKIKCNICQNELTKLNSFVKKCSKCQYQVSNLQPGIGANISGLSPLRSKNNRKVIQLLNQFVSLKEKQILDVGCSLGYLLDNLQEIGIKAIGLEPQSSKVIIARKKGHNVIHGYFPNDIYEKFDIIFLNDVFEHLKNPKEARKDILAVLKPNGIVLIASPCSSGIFFKLTKTLYGLGFKSPYERMWQKGFPSPHISYFNEKNLTLLFNSEEKLFFNYLDGITLIGLFKRLRATNNIFLSIIFFFFATLFYPLQKVSMDNMVIAFRKIN